MEAGACRFMAAVGWRRWIVQRSLILKESLILYSRLEDIKSNLDLIHRTAGIIFQS